jgi:hypothetical protein
MRRPKNKPRPPIPLHVLPRHVRVGISAIQRLPRAPRLWQPAAYVRVTPTPMRCEPRRVPLPGFLSETQPAGSSHAESQSARGAVYDSEALCCLHTTGRGWWQHTRSHGRVEGSLSLRRTMERRMSSMIRASRGAPPAPLVSAACVRACLPIPPHSSGPTFRNLKVGHSRVHVAP